jgi:hypothetical protein
MAVPVSLRQIVGKRELLFSLHTRDPAKAKRLAYTLTSQTYANFQKMASNTFRFNLADGTTLSTADTSVLRPYELVMPSGITVRADGEEDHRRALEALSAIENIGLIKAVPQQAPAPIQQQVYMEPQRGRLG